MKEITSCLSLLLLILLAIVPTSLQQPAALHTAVTRKMASRAMRYHHMMFHNMRNYYLGYSQTLKNQINAAGWAPPRPSKNAAGNVITNNNAGEDFLYMHRQMIILVNSLLRNVGRRPVTGFRVLPAANDTIYPMPASFNIPYNSLTTLVQYYKTESWYTYMKTIEARLSNATFLRTLTLGELGTYIEYTSDIHQGLHFRFASYNTIMRNSSRVLWQVVDKMYDVPANDWLVDLYSSQVNPWFWKLHGWIDNQINNWQAANGLSRINWRGTWMGGSDSRLPKSLGVQSDPDLGRFLGEGEEDNADNTKDAEDDDESVDSLKNMGDMDMTEDFDCDHYNITDMETLFSQITAETEVANYYSDLNKDYSNKIVNGTCPYDDDSDHNDHN